MSQAEPTQKPTFDPFELWRQFYEANEQAWTKTIREITTTKDFAEAQGKLLESMLAFQRMMRDGMSAQLNSLNLPTRDDVSRLGELVLSLEEKIDQLDDKLPAIEKRLAALERKVDGLVAESKKDQLADLEKKVGRIADLEKSIEALDRRISGMSERLPERVARQVEKAAEAAETAAAPARPAGGRARTAEK